MRKFFPNGSLAGETFPDVKKMPDTLCRQCGGELDTEKQCLHCHQPVQLVCTKCLQPTEVRFHSQCMYSEEMLCHTVAALA
ncbi:hypothetical protein [Nitrosopumilus sp.]|uniref:hypothetical protein n=1 Tax=Nitrosopumilus sp. TaxID=2024843 RepID=UPI00261CCF63|nr:hypothetical protein [Nitrosopumilus sp.]